MNDVIFTTCAFISSKPHYHVLNEKGFYVCEYSGLWYKVKAKL